jgi:hypothetical protein
VAILLYELAETNMTSWRSVTAAVDDTTAVLDSFSLKNRRTYLVAYAGRTIRQGREEGSQNESTCVFEQSAVNGEEGGDKGEESLEDRGRLLSVCRHLAKCGCSLFG